MAIIKPGQLASGSYTISGSFSGSFQGAITGIVTNAISASYALTASYAANVPVTSSYALSALSSSYSVTSSYALTASYAENAQTASYVLQAVSASFALTASYAENAQTASYVILAQTASYVQVAQTASYALTSSYASGSIVSPGLDTQVIFNNSGLLDANNGFVYSGSNVGIGTFSPAYKLSVIGKIALNDGGDSVFIGTNAGLSDNAISNINVGIGQNALQNNIYGVQNVAIGNNSLVANITSNNTAVGSNTLQFATTAVNNTAFGSYALNAATIGSGSTGIGTSALLLNTVGNQNTAIGNSALRLNTSGSNNVGVGGSVMFNNENGNDNVALGWNAARYFGTGTSALISTSGSIFLGTLARANASGEINQIVIGMNALGLGSNTVVLGNDNVITTALKGNIGIGKTNPTSKLDVLGNTTITGSLIVNGDITGSLFGTSSWAYNSLTSSYLNTLNQDLTIDGNLTVLGTASFTYVTSSIVQVGASTITLSTDNPVVRFGGINVIDSGSFGNSSTGSLLWDSQNNRWIYANPSGSTYDGGMLISGPRNTMGLGNEVGTTLNALMKGQGGDHITSSAMFEVSGSVGIGNPSPLFTLDVNGSGNYTNNLTVSGSLNITSSLSIRGSITTPVSNSLKWNPNSNSFYAGGDAENEITSQTNQGVTSVSNLNVMQTTWPSNSYYNGQVLHKVTAGESVQQGQLLYLASNGKWSKADALNTTKSIQLLGIALTGGVLDSTISVLLNGIIITTSHTQLNTATPGVSLYVAASNVNSAGYITQTAPSTAGSVVRLIGHNIYDNGSGGVIIRFQPDNTWLEL